MPFLPTRASGHTPVLFPKGPQQTATAFGPCCPALQHVSQLPSSQLHTSQASQLPGVALHWVPTTRATTSTTRVLVPPQTTVLVNVLVSAVRHGVVLTKQAHLNTCL